MAVEFVPTYAVEELKEMLSSSETGEQPVSDPPEATTPPSVVSEVVSKREASVKHFLMSDGSYMAVQYPAPIHYEDDNGYWQEIDNTLQYEAASEQTFSGYKNTANSFQIKFAGSTSEDKLVEIKDGNYTVSWEYLPSFSRPLWQSSAVIASQAAEAQEEDLMQADCLSGEV